MTTVPDPEQYSAARVRATARSVAGWTWERRDSFTGSGYWDRGSASQAWRARLRAERVWAKNASRDAEIVRLSAAGFSQRVVARSVGVSQSTVNPRSASPGRSRGWCPRTSSECAGTGRGVSGAGAGAGGTGSRSRCIHRRPWTQRESRRGPSLNCAGRIGEPREDPEIEDHKEAFDDH